MPKEEKNIDHLFRKGLDDFSASPPLAIWDRVESELDAEDEKRRPVFYWRLLAASVALFVAFASGYFFSEYKNQNEVVEHNVEIDSLVEKSNGSSSDETLQHESKSVRHKMEQDMLRAAVVVPQLDQQSKSSDDYDGANDIVDHSSYPNQKTIHNSRHSGSNIPPSVAIKSTPQGEQSWANTSAFIADDTDNSQGIDALHESSDFLPSRFEVTLLTIDDMGKVPEQLQLPSFQKLLPFPVEEQALEETKALAGQWAVGGQYAPLYALKASEEVDPFVAERKAMNLSNQVPIKDDSKPSETYAYSGRVSVKFETNKRWSLQSGVYYAKREQVVNNIVVFEQEVNNSFDHLDASALGEDIVINDIEVMKYMNRPSSAMVVSEPVAEGVREHTYESSLDMRRDLRYIEVPLLIRYKLFDKRFSMSMVGGINSSILVGNRATVKAQENVVWKKSASDVAPYFHSSSFGVGLSYQFLRHMSFNVEPSVRYALTQISDNAEKDFTPYTFALFTGLYYSF